jgi:hypothetical protein
MRIDPPSRAGLPEPKGPRHRAGRRGSAFASAALLLLVSLAARAVLAESAEQTTGTEELERLEERVQALEQAASAAPGPAIGNWSDRVRLGASTELGWFEGANDTIFDPDTFFVWDARFFVDADLGERIEIADHVVFRNIALSFEWDLVRRASLQNRVGELYVDFQGIAGQDWANLQLGRFQIPVGEAYLRYSQGRFDKPFVTDPIGGAWWWDEGIRLYGNVARGRLGYVASISDGDTSFNGNSSAEEQFTLKLYGRPTRWLYLSTSGLYSGQSGNQSSAGSAALWLGEAWARAFGAGSAVPNFQDGVAIADGPNKLRRTWLIQADAIATLDRGLRVWLSYGRYTIDSSGGTLYDRVLRFWIAEALLEGELVSPVLRPFYAAFRATGLGTWDRDEGYLLDVGLSGTVGWNARAITDYSAALGWRLNEYVVIRLEYTHRDIDLVRGVTPDIADAADSQDYGAIEVGARF